MLAVLEFGFDETARILPFGPLDEIGNNIAAQSLAVAYDCRGGLGAEVANEIYTIIYRAKLVKQ